MPSCNVMIDVSPIDSISLSAFVKREKHLRKSDEPRECEVTDDTYVLNQIEVIPKIFLVS